jgi:hypothetical protein
MPEHDSTTLRTRYYTFGFDHAHAVNGFTYDKDIVVKVTAPDPRAVMLQWFGQKWSTEYREGDLDMSYFPRGIKDLTPGLGGSVRPTTTTRGGMQAARES